MARPASKRRPRVSSSQSPTPDGRRMESFLAAVASRASDVRLPRRVVVTTGHTRDSALPLRARALAAELSNSGQCAATYDDREGRSLTKLAAHHDADAVLVVDSCGTQLRLRDGTDFKLHGGLGVLRLRNVLCGGEDTLVSVCGLREGDVLVDATAGQLQDSLAAAAAVGPSGRVVAIEASPLLWAVTSGRPCVTGDEDVDRMLNERIEVRLGEASRVLGAMPASSADVVYFDPMWVQPAKSSSSFDVLRELAFAERLSSDAIVNARRVARRAVVVMDQIGGAELERLGMPVHTSGQRKRCEQSTLGSNA